VEFTSAEEAGKDYPQTKLIFKPSTSPAVDPKNKELIAKLKDQKDILDLYPILTYDELTDVLDKWLNPENAEVLPEAEQSTDSSETTSEIVDPSNAKEGKSSTKAGDDETAAAFEDLFNS
jgi:hypothetical protein